MEESQHVIPDKYAVIGGIVFQLVFVPFLTLNTVAWISLRLRNVTANAGYAFAQQAAKKRKSIVTTGVYVQLIAKRKNVTELDVTATLDSLEPNVNK